MKRTIPLLIIILLWSKFLFATYFADSIYRGNNETNYEKIRCYIYKFGNDFHDDEAQPYRLQFYCDLGIYKIWDTADNGAPTLLTISGNNMLFNRVRIPKGKSFGFSNKINGKKIKVELLDENEKPIVGEPTYFHVTDFDGSQYRLHAKAQDGHPPWFPIFKISPNGKKHYFKDSGFEVLFDENGHIKQYRDTKSINIVSYPDDKTRVTDKYEINQVQSQKENGFYVLKPGAKPKKSGRFYQPEADQYRYMVIESFKDGELESTTTWTRGDKPWLYRLYCKVEGQDIPSIDDHHFFNEDGMKCFVRKRYSDNGRNQRHEEFILLKNRKWNNTYERKLKYGQETINAYDYIEDPFTQKILTLHTLEKTADGNWVKHEYDDLGRLTKTWKPLKQVVAPPSEKNPEVAELLDLFPDPSAEAIIQQQDYTYLPENPPADFSQSMTQGELTVYDYTPLTSDDLYDDTDKRPRTSFTRRNGIPFSTTWNVYGKRANGCLFDISEESIDPEATFGSPENLRTLTDYYAPDHPVASNKISSITKADGSMIVYYYDLGTWNKDSQRFVPTPKGKILQTESTEGKLIDGNWAPGTSTRTLITNPQGKTLFTQTRVLQADGTWEIQ
ncbi:hypothetical protein P3T73_01970 [Kiritimatiellota bacterium B12222]|nr:hypothetical protein P3T73_01970 [Kiritimatiellota bacterium B12222]